MRKITSLLVLFCLFAVTALGQITSPVDGSSYTLKCKATDHVGFIGDDGTIVNGRSAQPTSFLFEAAEGVENGFYIKSEVSGKYLYATGDKNSDVVLSDENKTTWVVNAPEHSAGYVSLAAHGKTNLYLNNVDGTNYLKLNEHVGGPGSGNACSLWKLSEKIKLPELSTEGNIKLYAIKSVRSEKYANYVGDATKMSQVSTLEATSLFYFTAGDGEAVEGFTPVKIHAVGTDNLMNDFASWTADGHTWYLSTDVKTVGDKTGRFITRTAELSGWNAFNDEASSAITYYLAQDAGSVFVFEAVDAAAALTAFEATKTSVATQINTLATNLPAIFTQASTIKGEVEALTATNVAEIMAQTKVAYTKLATAKAEANGKNVKLVNNGSGDRNGRFLGYDNANNRAAAVADGGDAAIWTIKANADGTFKLYNWVNNIYLGTPADPTPVVADAASAPSFTFISTAESKVALVSNGKMVHVANHTNYKLIQHYDLTDGASLWNVTVVPEIVVTRDQYNAAAAAKATLPYGIQQAYGLVTDAANYYSNYKSTAEGSYEALLDNVTDSYFHSAYGSEAGDGSGVHYIQATLAEGVDEFYFYMLPRSGNGNNRPKDITVSGSNDGETFTEICQVTTTLDGSMNPYVSAKLGTAGTTYKYIRLTVNSTNSGTKFFTLSELYFLPANADVTNLVDAYKNFASSSITSAEMATAATALINAETVLALSNIKKEVATLLTANATNHAETPALGQYSTAAYNALQAAYNDASATQESLENAITAFNKSKNRPVFTISGTKDYVVGKSIYDNNSGTLYFKTTNNYDKSMWWAFDQTTTTVGVTEEVVVTNYATDRTFWGASSVKIAKTSEADTEDGIFLLYTTGNGTPVHFQKDNSQIVRWSSTEANSGSAMTFTYIGTTYELALLTEEKIAALTELQTAYNANKDFINAEIGEGLGQYTCDAEYIHDFDIALGMAENILGGSLATQATKDISTIQGFTDVISQASTKYQINSPEAGKYYRFQGACEESLPNYYITGHTNADDGRIALTADADASTIYYFDGTNLIAYQSGLVIGLSSNHYTFASVDDNSKPASVITFAGSPRKPGTYTIMSADRYLHYKVYEGTVEIDRCSSDGGHATHDWYITEVTELPVTISAAGYASFYAPVEVTLPEGVTAHTVKENGEWATLSEAISIVPAGNGVILAGEATTYNLTVSNTDAADLEGALAGTVAKTLVTKEAGAYYVLGVKDEVVGLYNPVIGEDDTKFYNAGHKAYWYIPSVSQTIGFRFGGETTAIDAVEVENTNAPIYDLSGRRVLSTVKGGIYIQNGKKFIVK